MDEMEITFLGTGTSVGVPSIGCHCEVCESTDPKDKRLRSSIFIKTKEQSLLIDCGPDLRQQCLREGIESVDAVLITHPHADHIMGLDDLRRFTPKAEDTLPIYARPSCIQALSQCFFYIFNGENRYPGYFKPDAIPIEGPFKLSELKVIPIPVEHGKVECIGFAFYKNNVPLLGYIPDCKIIYEEGMNTLKDIECLVIDGLRHTPHPTHISVSEAVEISQELRAKKTWLTHISHEIMHGRDEANLPDNVRIAYDGLKLNL